ncbi:MAG TPA: wax ester/triacylglycerol synthase family O-acyltransferase [Thermoleophilaceae bacterium]|jgi:WS/DGAT/MGAT family acyltransferase
MPPTRLSALDASFLAAETPSAHMHVGWVAVFDPPGDGPRPTFEDLRDHIATRLDRAPRYRQRLAPVPLGVHDPVWVDDDRFDVARHVLRARSSNLDEIAAAAMSTQLERSRPLWECWVAPRLDDGRMAVVGKVHHCMVDGMAAVELAALLLDATPDPPPAVADGWRPEPAPGAASRLARAVVDRTLQEASLARLPARMLSSPGRIADAVGDARRAGLSLARSVRPTQPSSTLNPDISPLRHLTRLSRPIDDLERIKSHFGTTLNDVVLAVCAGGVRSFLARRGEPPVRLKAMVPSTRRDAAQAGALGNGISFLFLDLPTDDGDPVRRLQTVHRATAERKSGGDSEGGELLIRALAYAPHVVQRALARVAASPRTFNLVVSNIPGPRDQLWMLGCPLREAYPVVPLAEGHALAIGVTSVGDGLHFGLYADRKTLPDAHALARPIDRAIDELLALCGPRRGSRPRGRSGLVPLHA